MNKGILLKQFKGEVIGGKIRIFSISSFFLSFSHFVCIEACSKNELNEI